MNFSYNPFTDELDLLGTSTGSGQWTESAGNLYSPITDTVTVGTDTKSADTFTVNTASNTNGSGVAIHSIPTGVGGIDSFTKLCLPLSAIPFTDISSNAYTVTNTNITLDTTNKVIGAAGSAVSAGGTSDGLSIANVVNFDIHSGPWTISMWFRPNGDTGALYDKTKSTAPFSGYYLRYNTATNKLEYYTDTNTLRITQSDTLSNATWYYIEMNSDGATTTMYVGPVAGTAVSKGTTTFVPTEFNSPLVIFNQSSTAPLIGNIQEFKFDKGIQRHTGSFFVPLAPWDTGNPNSYPSIKFDNGISGAAIQTAKIWTDGSNSDQLTTTVGTTIVDTSTATDKTFNTNVKLSTAGNGFYIKEGSNSTMGTVALSGGTATINTTKVTVNSRIFLTVNEGTLTNVGFPYVSARVAGTNFTITSSNPLDASNVAWLIMEPT